MLSINMNTKELWISLFLLFITAVNLATADENSEIFAINIAESSICMVAESQNNLQKPVYFTQQTVEGDAQELVIIAPDAQDRRIVKRITYQQHKAVACHYPAIAITRGGDWGWFLVWSDNEKVYYTRMDSEALVFAPIKSLPIAYVTKVEFLPDTLQPTISLLNQDGQTQLLQTDDEGRYWQALK